MAAGEEIETGSGFRRIPSDSKFWAPVVPAQFGLHRVHRGRCSIWRL